MKTPEELNTLKEEIETLNKKLHELSEEELSQVSGSIALPDLPPDLPPDIHEHDLELHGGKSTRKSKPKHDRK